MSKAGKPARVDWDALEPHYRAGIRALKDIGKQFEVSAPAIVQHAKKNGWTRNLKAKIKAKADAKVAAAMLNEAVLNGQVNAKAKVNEALTVEVESEVQARIRLSQRKDIGKGRELVNSLMAELEAQTGSMDLMLRLGELMAQPDENGVDKLRDLYHKAISLGNRVGTMKSLAEALKNLIALERQAFGMDDKDPPPKDETHLTDEELEARLVSFGAARAA